MHVIVAIKPSKTTTIIYWLRLVDSVYEVTIQWYTKYINTLGKHNKGEGYNVNCKG